MLLSVPAFDKWFQDRKSQQMELNIFANLFNVEPADVPDNLQHKIIELQTTCYCEYLFSIFPLIEEGFPTPGIKHALKKYVEKKRWVGLQWWPSEVCHSLVHV